MAHETKQASTVKEKKHHGHAEDEISMADDDIEVIELTQQKTFYDRITRLMEKFASNRLGQMIIEKTDRVMKVAEDTAKWSLPQDDDIQLERPLPWIFFLTFIVLLRVLRIWLSVASYIVGAQPVTPYTMVYYIQTKRRRLRAIKVQGLKAIRNRETESTLMYSSNKNMSFMGKLRKLFSSAICKPGQQREVPTRMIYCQDNKATNKTERPKKRPRDEDQADQNLTLDEMLDKYANEDSDNDSDYIPKEDEEDDDSSTSHASSSSEEELEKEDLEKSPENQKESGKEQKDNKSTEQNETKPSAEKKDEIKENGGTKHRPKSKDLDTEKAETPNAEESDKEEMHTPNATPNTNCSNEDPKQENREETSAATTEVASSCKTSNTSNVHTPKSTHLSAPVDEQQNHKSTPGHESAASLKPSIFPASKTVNDKSYRTITTQTAIELDWTITIKTEITHTKHYPKLEKLNCSVDLTPASSTEDIFYSPIGSPQDFHSIFHPAPLVKGASGEDFLFSSNFHAQRS
ncbi:jabba isoform 2-T4 [Cochliomyia hominivorax]